MEMPSQPDNTPLPAAPDGTQFPVVGIGASAGGVKALTTFFAHMPPASNMAFLVIMHFPPEAESNLASILQRHTVIPVVKITEQVPIIPNQIYVIPPQAQLVLADGMLSLATVERTNGAHMPIDQCFRALAKAYDSRSAAIILSGTGSDGANGIKRIKEAGGVALVQEPQDAEFRGMPRMTISTGLVDFIQPAQALPGMLISYWQRGSSVAVPAAEADADILREIFAILRTHTGHDFTHYKRPTVRRRLARRMQVTGTTDLAAYLALLRSRPDEVQALLQNLLISVTNFFRDRDAWITLQTCIPQLFANKGPEDQVRVWVAACATGEEAYSLAMLLREFTDTLERPPTIQVFATDIDDYAIGIARQGIYPDSIAGDVSSARLARFFVAAQGGYRVKQDLRDLVLFARHNVLHDPPFSQVDLITCRNLLIYLNREMQEQVIQTFHFALRPQGYLLLGSAESIDGTSQIFATIDKNYRVFQRRPRPNAPASTASDSTAIMPRLAPQSRSPERSQPVGSFAELHQQLISPYMPPSVIVDENGEIVHLGHGIGPFLHFGEGEPSHNLLKVVQPDLRLHLRSALFMARQHSQAADVRRAQVEIDGETRLVNVIVEPIAELQWARGHLLVMFQDVGMAHATTGPPAPDAEALITRLEAELERTTSQLRTITEQYETVVEEYKAANEELHAINQELRAASEELEISQEEVQSINEELTTVNQELKLKVDEVSRAHNDLQNLMTSTQIATLFLDRDLRIKRFTPSAKQIFNLIPADVGRPLDHVTHTLLYDRLMQDAGQVRDTLATISSEVETRDEIWYLMRVNPYRTVDDHVDGVVLTFVDITERKRTEAALRASEEQFRHYVTAGSDIVYKMSADWREMRSLVGKDFIASTEQPSRTWLHTYIPAADQPQVLAVIEDAIRAKHTFELEHPVLRLDGTVGWTFSRAVPVLDAQGELLEWFGVASDVTARKQAEVALRESEEKYRTLFETMGQGYAVCELVRDSTGRALDHRLIELNPAFERLTGVSIAAARGHLAREVFPNLEQWWTETFDRIVRQGQPERIEYEEASLSRWYEVYVYPGQGHYFIELYEDITERKRNEQRQEFLFRLSDALRAEPNADAVAHRALRMLFEQMSLDRCYIGVYRLEEDHADLTHQVGNDRVPPLPDGIRLSDFREALRVASDRTLVIDDFAETEGLSDADRRNIGALGLRALIAASLRKGENTPLWTIVAVSASPRRWTQGEIALVGDVTERTWAAMERARAEEALRKSEERLRALLAKGTDMITISDRDGAILYASPSTERVSGYSAAEFQGSNPFANAIHPDDLELCRDAMQRLSTTPGLSLTLQHRAAQIRRLALV